MPWVLWAVLEALACKRHGPDSLLPPLLYSHLQSSLFNFFYWSWVIPLQLALRSSVTLGHSAGALDCFFSACIYYPPLTYPLFHLLI